MELSAISAVSDTPIIMDQRRVRLRFRDRSEVSLAIKYLIFAFNVLIWVSYASLVRTVLLYYSSFGVLFIEEYAMHILRRGLRVRS